LRVPAAGLLLIPERWDIIVPLAAATIAVDAVNMLPFASLRMQRKARYFATVRSLSIVVNVMLNVVFVAFLHMSIDAIFVAGLISSLLSTALLIPVFLRQLRLALDRPLLRTLLAFGLPTVPSGLAAMVVQVVDRPLMQVLADNTTAGIYQANYKLGIFMMLIVSMFQYAWQPFYLQYASQENAGRLFARVLTYFTLLASAVLIAVSFTINDLIRIPLFHHRTLIGPEYWSGVGIVPLVLLAYLLLGAGMIFEAGLLIRKKTGRLPLITGTGAVVNIVVNVLFIPKWGIYAGASATLAAYLVMAFLYWFLTRKVYPVKYEWGRLARIGVATAAVFSLWIAFAVPPVSELLWEALLFVLWIVLLFVLRFFEPRELAEARGMLERLRTRSA
jgi:O-antigen/teichoic acid export membrane protein